MGMKWIQPQPAPGRGWGWEAPCVAPIDRAACQGEGAAWGEPAQLMLCASQRGPWGELLLPPTASCRVPHSSPPDFGLYEELLQEPGTKHTPSIYWMPTGCQGLCLGWGIRLGTRKLGSCSWGSHSLVTSRCVLRVINAIRGNSKCEERPPGKAS